MKLLGYGEDALTLWALTRQLDTILSELPGSSKAQNCEVLYRPSFGRKGGKKGAQFGEFDFILLTERAVFLGESKWDRSPEEIRDGALNLRQEQKDRHKIIRFYIDRFAFGRYKTWAEFRAAEASGFAEGEFGKALAPDGSLLASNLEHVLLRIRKRFDSPPEIIDVLLYLHKNREEASLPSKGPKGFQVVRLDYSKALEGNGNMIAFEI